MLPIDLPCQKAPPLRSLCFRGWRAAGAPGEGEHLAFALPRPEFDATFERVKAAGVEYGDSFHSVGNMQGPGQGDGSRGPGHAVYMFDPE